MNQQNYNGTQQNQANAYRSSNPGTTGYGYAPMQQTQQSGVQYPYQQTQQKKSGGKQGKKHRKGNYIRGNFRIS